MPPEQIAKAQEMSKELLKKIEAKKKCGIETSPSASFARATPPMGRNRSERSPVKGGEEAG